MAELKYDPVAHDQKAFLEKASKHRDFREAYDALEPECARAQNALCAYARGPDAGSGRGSYGRHQERCFPA